VVTDPLALEALGARWWDAFDSADGALFAAGGVLPPDELRERGVRLGRERQSTVVLLDEIARLHGLRASFGRLATPRTGLRRLLGLPSRVGACVFNLDGVLIGSADLHIAAWAETFDSFLAARAERARGRFAPFDAVAPFNPRTDYYEHVHGRPRLDGVRAFLASRGMSLPDGNPADPAGAETVHGLANRKNEALARRLEEHGVAAFEGSRRYLEIAREAGVARAVVSASAHARVLLERAGLAQLVQECVDGTAIVAERLRPRPAPDALLAACRRLGAEPSRTAVFETTRAGVEAGRAAAFELVVGVHPAGEANGLRRAGADVVVSGLAELLERQAAQPARAR